MKILLIGDIFSMAGREMIDKHLENIKNTKGINFIIANGENIAHGNGITNNYYKFLLEHHINVVTLGNHSFANHDIFNFIDDAKNLIRPLNYPKGVPGKGFVTINYNNLKITIFQVMGRTFMNTSLDCPFETTENLLAKVDSDIYICDFHGEATSEKIAFAHHFDGRVNIIVGTHTHVQTNDAHILPKGTMYMTDLGMTGALDGVIGVEKETIIKRFITGLPVRHIPMETGRKQFNGLIMEINETNHKVTNFEIVNMIK
ncbi:MAG: TIGR00282 family metallophosphoesterase [Christensenellales bacterium]